jgi:ribonuclease VapC
MGYRTSLNLKSDEAYRLAKELSERTGKSMTAAVVEALRERPLRIEPVTEDQVRIARDAYREYGKGSGHRARLNFGDCFAYALARVTGEPLLFKGDDFTHTDIASALTTPG